MDDGNAVFDALVAGYRAAAATTFGQGQRLVQSVVVLPEGHPALAFGSTVMFSAAQLDSFPDEILPGLWSTQAEELLAAAPTEAQRNALHADRKALICRWRAVQRAVRLTHASLHAADIATVEPAIGGKILLAYRALLAQSPEIPSNALWDVHQPVNQAVRPISPRLISLISLDWAELFEHDCLVTP